MSGSWAGACLAQLRICRPTVSQHSYNVDRLQLLASTMQVALANLCTCCLVADVHEGCWVQASVRLMHPGAQDAAAGSRTQASSASGLPRPRPDSWPKALQHCIFRLPSGSDSPGGS